jgi:hypothetical protein
MAGSVDPMGVITSIGLVMALTACGSATADGGGAGRDVSRPSASASVSTSHPRDRGLVAVGWGWPDEHPLDPMSTTLHVGAYFMDCASGRAPNNPEAVVRYTDRYVHIGVWAEPLGDGAYTCEMGKSTPLTITLDEPIGSRKLIKDIPASRFYEAGSWELAEPVGPTSRTAVVLVGERGCEGVSPGAEVRYEVVPSPRDVMLHVEVLSGPQQEWVCGGLDSAYRLTVDLGGPLRDRPWSIASSNPHAELAPGRCGASLARAELRAPVLRMDPSGSR